MDERGEVRAVVATRDPDDPHHDLAWAVAGGGGGSFGVVTRFWMRCRGAEGGPGDLLPKAPSTVLCTFAAWSWGDITQEGFASFMSAYADWSKEHGSLDSPYLSLGHWLFLQHAETGMFNVIAQMDAAAPDARRLQRVKAAWDPRNFFRHPPVGRAAGRLTPRRPAHGRRPPA